MCALPADSNTDVIAQSQRVILCHQRKLHDKDGRASRWRESRSLVITDSILVLDCLTFMREK